MCLRDLMTVVQHHHGGVREARRTQGLVGYPLTICISPLDAHTLALTSTPSHTQPSHTHTHTINAPLQGFLALIMSQAILPGADMTARSKSASKLEAIASAAVRCAEKVQASLLVVFTHTGQSAQLVVSHP